jgi:hypothetical protein
LIGLSNAFGQKLKSTTIIEVKVGLRSSILIVILVFGVLFFMLFVSQNIAINPSPIQTKATLLEDDAIHIVKADIDKKFASSYASPTNQIGRIIIFDRYPQHHSLRLVYVHNNGALYYVTSNYTTITGDSTFHGYCFKSIDHGCLIRSDINSTGAKFIENTKGHLAYVIDGNWQSTDMKAADFFYLVDAESGKILWSEKGEPTIRK